MPKNRPRHRPAHNPSATERRKHEKPQSWLLKNRNKLLALGLAGTAAAIGFFRSDLTDLFKGKPPESAPISTINIPPQASPNLVPEANAEWLDQIQLPEMGPITESKINLMDRLPKDIDRAKLSHFDAQARQLFDEASKDLSGEKDVTTRQKRIFDFISRLIQAYKAAVGDGVPENFEIGSVRYVLQMQKINSILLPFDDYFYDAYDLKDKVGVIFFHADHQAEVQVGKEKMPIVYLAKGRSLLSAPDFQMVTFNAELNPPGGIAVLSEEGAERQLKEMVASHRLRCEKERFSPRAIDLARAREGAVALPAYHEAAHVYFVRSISIAFDFKRFDGLRKKGDISMGNYQLPYVVTVSANNAQLHELFANSIGLVKSGASAVFTAQAIATNVEIKNYRLAREVLWYELMNYPELDPAFRIGLKNEIERTQSIDFNKMAVAIDQLSDESLHKIGERMAKLALYLISENP